MMTHTATPAIYTLSLHDALPIFRRDGAAHRGTSLEEQHAAPRVAPRADRKSTRLNSSHRCISYAVFCLKKKKNKKSPKSTSALTLQVISKIRTWVNT